MSRLLVLAMLTATVTLAQVSLADDAPPPGYDEALAQSVGADEHGMRRYVLVRYYGSAALMMVADAHKRVQKKSF